MIIFVACEFALAFVVLGKREREIVITMMSVLVVVTMSVVGSHAWN